MAVRLYVGNLGYRMSSESLEELFTQAGMVDSAQIVTTIAGNSRGFGFVEMSTRAEGSTAIALFDGKEVCGRSLTVYEEKPPTAAAAAAGISFDCSQRRKESSYAASRAIRWPRP